MTAQQQLEVIFREIKFRGWHKMDGWVYGYYAVDDNGNHLIYGIDPDDGSWGAWIVEPDSVGQYTGLKDKNGKEIYEGDIVTNESYTQRYLSKWVVVFEDGCFWLVKQGEPSPRIPLFKVVKHIIVIGNIYEGEGGSTIKTPLENYKNQIK